MKQCIFSILALSFVTVYAQELPEDHVITMSGDTITGEIKHLTKSEWKRHRKFVIELVGETQKSRLFLSKDIKGYKAGRHVYVRKSLSTNKSGKKKSMFFRLVDDGKMKVYSITDDEEIMVPISEYLWFPVPSSETKYYLEINGELVKVNRTGFKRNMAAYFSEDEDIVNSIQSGSLKYKDLEKIVTAYNAKGN